jgi:hypothetical protein
LTEPTEEDSFNFTLKELQMLKVSIEYYFSFGLTTEEDNTYNYDIISRRIGQQVKHEDFVSVIRKLEGYINGLAMR